VHLTKVVRTCLLIGRLSYPLRAVLEQRSGAQRRLLLADSFEGIPAPRTARGLNVDGPGVAHGTANWPERYSAGQARVRSTFRRYGLWDERVVLIPGFFNVSLPSYFNGAPLGRHASKLACGLGEPASRICMCSVRDVARDTFALSTNSYVEYTHSLPTYQLACLLTTCLGSLALIHIDADAYESVLDALYALYPRLSLWETAAQSQSLLWPDRPPALTRPPVPAPDQAQGGLQPRPASASLGQLADMFWFVGPTPVSLAFHIHSTYIRRLSPGGHVIIDDFHLPAVRTAVHEYREAHGVSQAEEPLLPVPALVENEARPPRFGQHGPSRLALHQHGAAPGSVSLGQPAAWAALAGGPIGPALSTHRCPPTT
jgi:hypothetical protein